MFSLRVALRFLKSSKGQTFVIMLGIAIGVSVQIFVGSLIQGLQADLINTTVGSSPHVTISSEERITNYEQIIEQVSQVKGVKYVTAVTDYPAFITSVGKNPVSVLLRGFDLDSANNIYDFYSDLEGAKPTNENEILIGKELKDDLSVEIGDTLEIQNTQQQGINATIVGIFDKGVSSVNRLWMVTNTATVENAFNISTDEVTSITLQVNDVFASDKIAEEIQNILSNDDVAVVDWQAQNESLLSGLSGQSISSYMIQVFVLLSVLIGIASVLAITVMQKSKQIGILKAMGIDDITSAKIFLFEGMFLGIGGAILGVIIGVVLSLSFSTFAVDSTGEPILEISFNIGFLVLSAGFAILASMLAALYPAKRSSSIDIIEIIRNS